MVNNKIMRLSPKREEVVSFGFMVFRSRKEKPTRSVMLPVTERDIFRILTRRMSSFSALFGRARLIL